MNKFILLFACFSFAIASCKKEHKFKSNGIASVFVVNGTVGPPSIMLKMNGKLNTSGITTGNISKLNFGLGGFYYSEGKTTPVDILSGLDTSFLKTSNFEFANQKVYTMLLAGQSNSLQHLLVEESNYPYINYSSIPKDADSVINVRIINLSPDAGAINVKLQGSSTNEVSSLGYMNLSNFKAYSAKASNLTYNFEFRDATTNALLFATPTVLSLSATNRFKNVALVLRGMKTPGAGQQALGVSTVNYFQ